VHVVDILVLLPREVVAGREPVVDVELLDLLAPAFTDRLRVYLCLCAGAVGGDEQRVADE